MTSEAKTASCRRNGKKSMGPKTPEGRERSSMNAYKHGLRSKKQALIREDMYAFENRKLKWIAKVDPTLKDTVERAQKRIEFHLEKLRRKSGKALDRKNGLIALHEQYLESLLHPHKALQSRELCLLPFLARWGSGGLSELQKLSSSKKIGHHFIVQLP